MRSYQATSHERRGQSAPSRTTPGMPWWGPDAIRPVATSSATAPTTAASQTLQVASAARASPRAAPATPGASVAHNADKLADGARGPLELRLLLVGQADLDHLLEARGAQLAGHAHEDPAEAVLALEQRGAGQHALLVEHDRVDHLHRRGGRGVVRGPRLEMTYDLGAAVAGALHDLVQPCALDELAHRDARDVGVGDDRDHLVTVAAQHEAGDVAHRDAQLPGDEGAEARRVEHARHADHPLLGEAAGLVGHGAHGVERVRDHDQDRVGRLLHERRGHVADDLLVR